jgi:hypothetical protein
MAAPIDPFAPGMWRTPAGVREEPEAPQACEVVPGPMFAKLVDIAPHEAMAATADGVAEEPTQGVEDGVDPSFPCLIWELPGRVWIASEPNAPSSRRPL